MLEQFACSAGRLSSFIAAFERLLQRTNVNRFMTCSYTEYTEFLQVRLRLNPAHLWPVRAEISRTCPQRRGPWHRSTVQRVRTDLCRRRVIDTLRCWQPIAQIRRQKLFVIERRGDCNDTDHGRLILWPSHFASRHLIVVSKMAMTLSNIYLLYDAGARWGHASADRMIG